QQHRRRSRHHAAKSEVAFSNGLASEDRLTNWFQGSYKSPFPSAFICVTRSSSPSWFVAPGTTRPTITTTQPATTPTKLAAVLRLPHCSRFDLRCCLQHRPRPPSHQQQTL